MDKFQLATLPKFDLRVKKTTNGEKEVHILRSDANLIYDRTLCGHRVEIFIRTDGRGWEGILLDSIWGFSNSDCNCKKCNEIWEKAVEKRINNAED